MHALILQAPDPFTASAGAPINLTAALPYLTGLATADVALRAAAVTTAVPRQRPQRE